MPHKKPFLKKAILILGLATLIGALFFIFNDFLPVWGTPWTDPTITAGETLIRKVHMDELRSEINTNETDIGLTTTSWTDSVITAGETLIRAVHFTEARDAIVGIFNKILETPPIWTDATLTPGETIIRKTHLDELRTEITNAYNLINAKKCCGSYGGSNTGSAGACPGTDDSACGTIDCSGWYIQTGDESPSATEYCYNKQDITTDRCEGIDDCKDANTTDCEPQPNNAVQYSCSTCCKIDDSVCTGTTRGSCSYYSSATQGPTGDYYYQSPSGDSPTAADKCYYRDYHCTGNSCGETYDDSYQYECGTCCYIHSSNCTGGTKGSCSYYSSATQGPTSDYCYDSGGDSPTGTNYCKKRDYHCTGNSCAETYSDSTVATCGTCKYCNGCSCATYANDTVCGGTCDRCEGGLCHTCRWVYHYSSTGLPGKTTDGGGQIYCTVNNEGTLAYSLNAPYTDLPCNYPGADSPMEELTTSSGSKQYLWYECVCE